MLDAARASAQQPSNIRFVQCSAEAFTPDGRYDLAVAAESLHGMDWQLVAAYVESFHSRNGFSRERMQAEEAAAFDAAVGELVLAHRPDGVVNGEAEATLVRGTPGALPDGA